MASPHPEAGHEPPPPPPPPPQLPTAATTGGHNPAPDPPAPPRRWFGALPDNKTIRFCVTAAAVIAERAAGLRTRKLPRRLPAGGDEEEGGGGGGGGGDPGATVPNSPCPSPMYAGGASA